jgi:hypothetical protein
VNKYLTSSEVREIAQRLTNEGEGQGGQVQTGIMLAVCAILNALDGYDEE